MGNDGFRATEPDGDDGGALSRRDLVRRGGGVLAGGFALSALLAACGEGSSGTTGTSGSATAAGSGATPSPSDLKSKTVIYATYGGATAEARQTAYIDPFMQESGIQVKYAAMNPSRFYAMAKAGRSQWDSGDVDGFDGVRMVDEGVIAKMPEWAPRLGIPSSPETDKYRDYFVSPYALSYQILYDARQFPGRKPESWADFWDVKKFPGKRAWTRTFSGTAEAALTADGVPQDQLYPIDIPRAIAKLDELRPNIGLFYESFAQGVQAVQQGDVAMCYMASSPAYNLMKQTGDAGVVWNQAILIPWSANPVPNGAPNPDGMYLYNQFVSENIERQVEFTKLTGYGPPSPEAFDALDEKTLDHVPNSPKNAEIAVLMNNVAVAKQAGEYVKQYGAWLAQG